MKSDLRRRISTKLIELRENKGLSQEKLANTAGLDRSYISRLERGIISPTLDNFYIICKALDVPPHQFLEDISYT